MQALTQQRYGAPAEVLELLDLETPVPGEGEVLVRILAASVNPADWHLIRGEPYLVHLIAGLRAPKDPRAGGDCAGIVEAVGPGVDGIAVGDEVFGVAHGSFAELAVAKTDRIARKPAQLSFEQAASIPIAGCTALQALRDHAGLKDGQRVLIIGAAGGVGSFAVQLAKHWGAAVTGVCGTANVEFVRALGADDVVDYMRDEPSGTFDIVLQIAGDATPRELRRLLTPRGTLVAVGSGVGRDEKPGLLGPIMSMLTTRLASRKNGKRSVTFIAKIRRPDLETVAELVTPHVERVYPLAQTAEALGVIESGHVRGKIVIAVPSASARPA